MPAPLVVLEPPYEVFRTADGEPPALGGILVGDLTGTEAEATEAARTAAEAARNAPWCPVCLVVGPAVHNGPVLAELAALDASVAWIVRTAGGFQPDPQTVVEAVQARPAPDHSEVTEYLRRRTGNADAQAHGLTEQVAQRLAVRGEKVGWEWVVEAELRRARGEETVRP